MTLSATTPFRSMTSSSSVSQTITYHKAVETIIANTENMLSQIESYDSNHQRS